MGRGSCMFTLNDCGLVSKIIASLGPASMRVERSIFTG